jgi:FkbM family methyltransferase
VNIAKKSRLKVLGYIKGYIKVTGEFINFHKNVYLVKRLQKLSREKTALIIDCGFNQGIVADKLLSRLKNFSFIGFEVQQNIKKFSDNIKKKYPDRKIDVIYSALSDVDGVVEYFEPVKWGKNYKGGTTTVSKKKSMSIDYSNPKLAPGIDFSTWLLESIPTDCFVFLKMDIEGAEYKVISKLLETKSIDKINVMAVEWHAKKFPEPKRSKFRQIERRLKEYSKSNKIVVLDWY